MAPITSLRGYDSSFRGSIAPGAFYQILTSDFGEPIPGAPTLTLRAASGTLASSTANVQLTWITAEGVSLPSTSTSILISAANDGLSVVIPTVPTNGAPVIGYQIYSQGSTGAPLLNSSATGTSPAPQTFTTNQGAVIGFPVTTTTNFLNSYGTGAVVPLFDHSGIQLAFPSLNTNGSSNSSADYYFVVPNSGSQWKTYKSVGVMRPDSVAETAGVSASYPFDCINPLYPGATPGAATFTQVGVAPGTYMNMNGSLFISAGSANIASAFIGAAAFNVPKGTTVTDGGVTWLCLGKATLIHTRFANSSNAVASPVIQEYDLFEL